jgi:hypothetical protein
VSCSTSQQNPKRGVGLEAIGEEKLNGAALEMPRGDIVDMTTVGLAWSLKKSFMYNTGL